WTMAKVRRLMAVATVLVCLAVSTSSMTRGGPAAKKNRGLDLPPDGQKPAAAKDDAQFEQNLAQAKFDKGGVISYVTREKETLVALQAKHTLKPGPARPRDILVLVNTSASLTGAPLIAARQIAEDIVDQAGPGDRVSLWTLNTASAKFTRSL